MLTSLTNVALLQPTAELEAEEEVPPDTGIPNVAAAVGVVVIVGVEVGVMVEVAVGVGWAVRVAATSVPTCTGAVSVGCGAAAPQALNKSAPNQLSAIKPVRF